ncbi:hypothetical protein [Microcystis sp. MC19]|uniref:hypothetical protein n=1 Tax=Microcystis sp. MC19 TaxID=1967666 RepID=UPI001C1F98CC|nr:hypothetical protein [Microcystis sp. MC19]
MSSTIYTKLDELTLYSLEGSQLAPQYLSKLIIVIAIAYTSATLQGKKIKDMGIQKYVTRPEKR